MSKCRLSVIIPVYNAEKTIDRCLSTIVNSGTGDFEIILVNDGSTDNSLESCQRWECSHEFIRVINKKNQGVSAARNSGLEDASGEYVTFVDSDDYVSTSYIKTILEYIKSNWDLYIFKSVELRNDTETDMKTWITNSGKIDKSRICDRLTKGFLNVPWDKVFKRELIVSTELKFEEQISIGEDWIFSMEYAKYANSFCLINEKLYYYVINEGSLTRRKISFDYLDNGFLLFKRIIDFARFVNQDLIYAYSMSLQILTNTCGRLIKSGYKRSEIEQYLTNKVLYKEIIQYPYRDIKSWVRVQCLRMKLYALIAVVFDGD